MTAKTNMVASGCALAKSIHVRNRSAIGVFLVRPFHTAPLGTRSPGRAQFHAAYDMRNRAPRQDNSGRNA